VEERCYYLLLLNYTNLQNSTYRLLIP